MLGWGRFHTAKECYESLRSLGDVAKANACLKKLHDTQEWDKEFKMYQNDENRETENPIEQFPKPAAMAIKKKGKRKK